MASPFPSVGEAWRTSVTLQEDIEIARLLIERLPPESAPRAVSVTDLVAPRRAFWRAVAPVKLDPVRQHRVDAGRAFHRRLGVVLSSEGALEVRVRRGGIVGRIDLLSDLPVEVKTSSSSVGADQLRDARPDQVEQLAMYCALAGGPAGRLLTFVVGDGVDGRVQSVDIAFGDTESVRAEMGRRAGALRAVWAERGPSGLPACRWFGRGCEFHDAAVCDCTGGEPTASESILSEVVEVTERTDISQRLEARLREVPGPTEPPTLQRFRDLLYPRRAYFERTGNEPVSPVLGRGPLEPTDLYARLTEALETGPLGEVSRLPSRSEEPEEEVGGFRGAPYLVRTSRGRDRASDQTLLDRQPQYALELGLRCVATGTSTAHLVLGRDRARNDAERVQVFEYRFAPASPFSRLWRERTRQLAAALVARDPGELPGCPEWMYDACPYRPACACGGSGTRSQR